MGFTSLLAAVVAALAGPALAQTGMEPVPDRQPGDGEGSCQALLIAGATVIEGTGAPPVGPVDILVQGNRIKAAP